MRLTYCPRVSARCVLPVPGGTLQFHGWYTACSLLFFRFWTRTYSSPSTSWDPPGDRSGLDRSAQTDLHTFYVRRRGPRSCQHLLLLTFPDLGINTAPSNRRWPPLLKIKYIEGGPPSLCLLGWPWGNSIRSCSNPAQLERTLLVKYIHFAQETENTSISIGFFFLFFQAD